MGVLVIKVIFCQFKNVLTIKSFKSEVVFLNVTEFNTALRMVSKYHIKKMHQLNRSIDAMIRMSCRKLLF